MSEPFGDRCTCERCKYVGYRYDKYGQAIFKEVDDTLLCSSCRVNDKLEWNEEGEYYE